MEWDKYLHSSIIIPGILLLFCLCLCLVYLVWKNFPVNCWFCNSNWRVHFKKRNSWFCHKCQQYNGFTSDGDYNKPMYQNMQPSNKIMYNYHKFSVRPAGNGLCLKCNINQRLKIMQLANFKPMNQKNFDQEVEQFKLHLEEVYKLCKKCKKFLNMKLQSEKGAFLIPKKNCAKTSFKQKTPHHIARKMQTLLKSASLKLTYIFLVVVVVGICMNANLFFSKKTLHQLKQHLNNLTDTLNYNNYISENIACISGKYKEIFSNLTVIKYSVNVMTGNTALQTVINYVMKEELRTVTVFYCLKSVTWGVLLLHGTTLLLELGRSFRTLFNMLLWTLSGYFTWSQDKYLLIIQPILAILIIWNSKVSPLEKVNASNMNNGSKVWKNMKNLSNGSSQYSHCSDEEDDLISEDSDFDPAIGSERTSTPEYHSLNQSNYVSDSKSHICRSHGFQISSPFNQSFSNYNQSSFRHAQNPNASFCTTELDKGIGTLSLGNKNSPTPTPHNVFYSNCYNSASPAISSYRPVISPSRFVYSTQQSWVAGGYWGAESPKKAHLTHNTSRSSSQSSGFESMTSGNQKKGHLPSSYGNGFLRDINNGSNNFSSAKSIYNDCSFRKGNVFQNATSSSTIKLPTFTAPNGSHTNTRSGSLNVSRENSFVTQNPTNSFIPLDKLVH